MLEEVAHSQSLQNAAFLRGMTTILGGQPEEA